MTEILRRGAFVFIALSFLIALAASIPTSAARSNPPGNNGTLKVHEYGTPSGTENNDPKVCSFNFEGFKFDRNQTGLIKVSTQGGGSGSTVKLEVPFGPTNRDGYAETEYINMGGKTLENGQYKSTLYGKDRDGNYTIDLKAKSKVFKVICETEEPDYKFLFEKEWKGDKVDLDAVKVTFYIDDEAYAPGEKIEVEPGEVLAPLSEEVTGLPENCRYKSNLPKAFRIPRDPKEVTTLDVTNYVKCKDAPAPDYEFQFEKEWEGDEIDLEGVEVTFYIGDTEWQPGDDPVAVEPGEVLAPLSEEVTGLPENCTYESDLPNSYTVPSEEMANGFMLLDYEMEDDSTLYTLEVTNTVECEDDPVTPVTPEGETETPVTPASSTATTQQVTATPVGAVDAGAGSALTALVGLFGSTGLVSLGAFLRRFSL